MFLSGKLAHGSEQVCTYMMVTVGTHLGRYKILLPLGEGGMGEVYLALDSTLNRKVALKLLPAFVNPDDLPLRRFRQEALTVSALNHPNIITIYEVGQVDSTHFIATEFIDGVTLRAHLAITPMILTEALDVAIQVASALAAAHAAGITHRDIKPENIMLRADGYVKVLDFGLAKLGARRGADPTGPTLVTTADGILLGTVGYMSPEQARGLEVDARTDVWSLGAVLYEMVTGRVLFTGATRTDVLVSILDQEPAALSAYVDEVPEELERIVWKALRKEREERYQTVKDLALDLKNLKQELEFKAKLDRSTRAELTGRTTLAGSRAQVASIEVAKVNTIGAASGAEYTVGEIRRPQSSAVRAGAALVMAVVMTVFAYLYFARSGEAAIDTVAVLPFVNVSGDPDTEYLSDGITESLINNLSQLPNLRVKSGISVSRYKGQRADPQTVGRELGVRAVLTGRVVQRGDGLSINAELVDVRDNTHIWGDQYNRSFTEIFTTQEEISREISEKLRLRLTGEEKRRLARRYTASTDAYQLYLKGRYHWNRRTTEGISKAIEYFQQSIAIDPSYAQAYAGLADSYALLPLNTTIPSREALPKAKAAATKALELDDRLAEAHASLAYVKYQFDGDWPGAEREFKRAIELNPNYATAHHWYSNYLSVSERHPEAIAEMKLAQELEPLSLVMNAGVGWAYYYARQYDQAIEQFRKTLELDPNFNRAYTGLGVVYEQKGMHSEAVAALQRARDLSGGSPLIVAFLGHAYATAGKRSEARAVLSELKELSARGYLSSPYYTAMIYAGLGERDQALQWLEKAHKDRSSGLVWLRTHPVWDNLRADPRFDDLMRRVDHAP